MDRQVILSAENLSKEYHMGEVKVKALQGVSFSLYENEFVVILGPSGSGKSTMLNIIGGIDRPSGGSLHFRGVELSKAGEKELTYFRRRAVGFVFQFYNLIPNLTARENILLACELSEDPIPADELLEQVGLAERADHFPSQLSGGEQQRVAIARAVGKNPPLLLCDEPTGALDYQTGIQVLRILRDYHTRYGKTICIITHNAGIGQMADRVFHIKDGQIERITSNEHPLPPEEVSW